MATQTRLDRPAFYALRAGGWRDAVTLLHLPYTAWHLSYVAIGAAVAPHFYGYRLVWTLVAFFLGVGVAAHALDELHGRPLGTRVSDRLLVAVAGTALAGACAIGVVGALTISAWLFAFVGVGVGVTLTYNLELFGGRMHSDTWFALAWGAFPALTAYWAQAVEIRVEAVFVAGACFMLSVAQRRLSTPVRELRRRTVWVRGEQRLKNGSAVGIDEGSIAAPMEGALMAWAIGLVLLAAGLVATRL